MAPLTDATPPKYSDPTVLAVGKSEDLQAISTDLQALLNEAGRHRQAGQLADAERLYRQILAADSGHADALHFLATTLHRLGRLDEALAAYDAAIRLKPDNAAAHTDRGVALHALGRPDAALASYDTAIALAPNSAIAYYNRGMVLFELMRLDEAVASYDQAIAFDPTDGKAHSNRGNALKGLDRLDQAVTSYDQAIAIDPTHAKAHSNRGAVLQELGAFDAAIASYDKAIALAPDFADAQRNRAMLLLLMGDFARGWPLYEWRWAVEETKKSRRNFSQPLWLGAESLAGKTILIHAEQGLGDTVLACRYLRPLQEMGAKILFAPQRVLRALMGGIGVPIVDIDDVGQSFDFQCPLLSLPLAFNTALASIPSPGPYLHAEPARIAQWRSRIGGEGFRIGICWQGSTGRVDVGRSFPITEFRSISGMPDVRLISLHKGKGEAQLQDLPGEMRVETLGADFDAGPDAFLDSAAVMMLCDLVVTSDTAIAHLAGALGRPTWVALKQMPDWRWMMGRDDSPWYPTARLFRQKARGDWRGVFADIEIALRALVPNFSPGS